MLTEPLLRAALSATRRAQDAAELVRLTAYVTELKRRHDDMKQLAARKETALQSRVDSVKVRAASRAPLARTASACPRGG